MKFVKISKSYKLSTLFPPAFTIFTIFTIYSGVSHLRACVLHSFTIYNGISKTPTLFPPTLTIFNIFTTSKNCTENFVQQHLLHLPLVSLPVNPNQLKYLEILIHSRERGNLFYKNINCFPLIFFIDSFPGSHYDR